MGHTTDRPESKEDTIKSQNRMWGKSPGRWMIFGYHKQQAK